MKKKNLKKVSLYKNILFFTCLKGFNVFLHINTSVTVKHNIKKNIQYSYHDESP